MRRGRSDEWCRYAVHMTRGYTLNDSHIWLELTADQDLRRLIELNPHWEMTLHQTYSDFTDK